MEPPTHLKSRRPRRAPLVGGLIAVLAAGPALPAVETIALHCETGAEVAASDHDMLCAIFLDTLRARYPEARFISQNAPETEPQADTRQVTLRAARWHDTGIELQLSWQSPQTGVQSAPARSLSVSDTKLTKRHLAAFFRRFMDDITLPF
ncbi:MAG: hypothetical protein U1D35_05455 [Paracoccaceae bacterium]|nr:hypothetical protein [Paracoccaceae bacterium]